MINIGEQLLINENENNKASDGETPTNRAIDSGVVTEQQQILYKIIAVKHRY